MCPRFIIKQRFGLGEFRSYWYSFVENMVGTMGALLSVLDDKVVLW